MTMGLGKTVLACGVVAFAAMTYQGTKSYIDSTAGKGTFDAGVHYGTQSASQNFAEVPTAANSLIEENKAPIGNLIHQGTGAISSATGGQSWDQPADPSTQQAPTTTVKP